MRNEAAKRRRLSARERKQVYDMFGGRCAYCGCQVTFRGMQIDHKIPLRTGGEDTIENMYPACRSCNHYKHTLDVEGYRTYLQRIPERLMRDSVAYLAGVRFGLVKPAGKKVTFYFEEVQNEQSTANLI